MTARRIQVLTILLVLILSSLAAAQPAQTGEALAPDPSLQEVPPPVASVRPGATALLLLTFALLILLPFVPGLIEVYWPRDRYPLPVNTGYTKDPRFYGRSARELLGAALDVAEAALGNHEIEMSKPETVEVRDDWEISAGAEQDAILVARGELVVGEGAVCERELFAGGHARVGADAVLRTLSCDADATLARGVALVRWLDCEGDVTVGPDASLGISAAAGGSLVLDDGVVFARLFGSPVSTTGGGERPRPEPAPVSAPFVTTVDEIGTIEDLTHFHRDDLTVSPGDAFERPLVVKGDLVLEAGAMVPHAVRVYGELRLERDATVGGDAFVEGDVVLGEGAAVRGNVFTQGAVRLGTDACVGMPGACKSVIGKREVELGSGVVVHGYILTDGRGRVSCAGSS